MVERKECSEREWRERLSPSRFRVLRGRATERPFTGAYWDCDAPGVYHCGACDEPLFDSQAKTPGHSGWPSFVAPIADAQVALEMQHRFGKPRTEVSCATCGSHLGFQQYEPDHPAGLKYRLNSAALKLQKRREALERAGDSSEVYARSSPSPGWESDDEPMGLPF